MMKLNKDTFEVEFVETLTCFCGGGRDDDSGGGGGDDDSYTPPSTQVERGRGRTTSAPPPPPPPPRDDGPDETPPAPPPPPPRVPDQVSALQQQRATEEAIANVTQALFPTQPSEVQIATTAAATPEQRAAVSAANDRMFDEFFANEMFDQQIDATLNPIPVFENNDPAGDFMLNPSLAMASTPADISVGASNLPPATITDAAGTTFDTTSGDVFDLGLDVGPGFEEPSVLPANMVDRYTGMDSDPVGQTFSNIQGEVNALTSRGPLGREMMRQLSTGAGARPNFDMTRDEGQRLRGVYKTRDVFGFPVTTYTGLDDPAGMMNDAGSDDMVPPQTNPLTGAQQCPDGYIFDDFLQACRPMTRSEKGINTGGTGTSPDMFYRQTALDTAPTNLPSGFDFDAANRRFTQSYAYRPDFYRSPMSLTGFTRLS